MRTTVCLQGASIGKGEPARPDACDSAVVHVCCQSGKCVDLVVQSQIRGGRGGAVVECGVDLVAPGRATLYTENAENQHFRRECSHLPLAPMLRLTKKADYGLMALKYLAEHGQARAQSAKDIAEAYHIPPPLLAKILQTLARSGLLMSHAGTNGGYSLARPAGEISAFEAIRAIDGPLFITSCITIHGTCDLAGHCTIKEPLRKVNDSIKELLSGIRIADLVEQPDEGTKSSGAAVAGGLVTIAM